MIITRLKHAWRALWGEPYEVEKVIERDVIAKRNFLGSIDKEQVEYVKNMREEERRDHVGSVSVIFQKAAFKRELNALMDTQVYWMGEKADGDRQHLFGKGTLNGIQLVFERFELLDSEARDRSRPKEAEDPLEKYNILSEFSTPQ